MGWGAKSLAIAVLASALSLAPAVGASAKPTGRGRPTTCDPQVLVLSAFPAELDAVLARAQFEPAKEIEVDGRSFFPGRLSGHRVVMAMTGIGPQNARAMIAAAFHRFTCPHRAGISAVIFSGVAGSSSYIGDVMVPARWTEDAGATWTPADPDMLAVARQVAAGGDAELAQDAGPVGDPTCPCDDLAGQRPIHLPHAPEVLVGGDGVTTDPLGGRTLPCFPFGGDIFGCRPCRAPARSAPDIVGFAGALAPFIDPDFFLSYLRSPEASGTPAAAADNESAPVAVAAAGHGVPFIAFRAVSDGEGDPLMLPGFPVQFAVYQRIAAHNAAAATAAVLQRWRPT
jgi:nucleoside phosphorylase